MTKLCDDSLSRRKKDVIKVDHELNIELLKEGNRTGDVAAFASHRVGDVLMMELPSEHYFHATASSIKALVDWGYEGVYVSFQRPFVNIFPLFQQQGVNVEKLLFIDGATACTKESKERNPRCVHMATSLDIAKLSTTICRSLSRLSSSKRFVCIDSLSTMAMYEPFSDPTKVAEVVVHMVREQGFDQVTFLLNVAEDFSQKRFFKDIARYADEFIHIGICT